MPQMQIPPRPTLCDEPVLRKQAADCLPAVQKALGASWTPAQCHKAQLVLEEVIGSSTDGYERARSLQDNHKWDGINAQVVAALTPTLIDLDRCLEEAVTEWVLAYGVRFPARENDEINFRNKSNTLVRGRVVGVMSAQARGLVQMIGVLQGGHPVREYVDAEQVTSVKRNNKTVSHNAFLLLHRANEGVLTLPLTPPRPANDGGAAITEAAVTNQTTIEKTV